MNSFSFCLSGKLFINLSFNSNNFAEQSILGWKLYSFSILNVWCYFLLAHKVSVKKCAGSFMGVPLYAASCFSLAAFKVLSLSLSLDILIIMWLGVGLSGCCFFLDLSENPGSEYLFSFPGQGNFQPLFIQIRFMLLSLSSPSGSPIMKILVHLMLPHKSLKLSSFFLFFFCLFL